MKPVKFKVCFEGETDQMITVTFTVNVNAGAANPLVVKDAGGNVLADGSSVALVDETVGVADAGQVVCDISGGQPPYNFSVASGAVPDGLQLNATTNPDGSETVTLSGTPTTASTPGTPDEFALQISDSATPPAISTAKVKRAIR